MKTKSCKPFRWSLLLSGLLAIGLVPAVHAQAQNADQGDSVSGYRTGENTPRNDQPFTDNAQGAAPATDPKTEGPVRMARFAYVKGDVTWRPDSNANWSKATDNLPLRQGAQITVNEGGRAELQFDDGSALRLGNGAVVTLKVLFSDDKGEFTEITLTDGLATLHSRHNDAVYQVDTPIASVKFSGETQVRFGVDGGSEIAVQTGTAAVEGSAGKTTVTAGNYLYLRDGTSPFTTHTIPAGDTWDTWNSDRDKLMSPNTETAKHVPANIGQVAGDLDSNGTWHDDPKYGWVWAPQVSQPDWRPYSDGNWTWVDPYGWTWVSNETWGWAPYHYGTWVDLSYGWAWCPGPAYQFWCPGVVSFCSYGGRFGWAPLCPWEVRYPGAFSLGFWGGGWGLSFSIGWCGCFYPGGGAYCVGRPWDNHFVNGWHDGFRSGFGGGFRNGVENAGGSHFTPFNGARGGTVAGAEAFTSHGSYSHADASFFSKGTTVSAPAGKGVLSGPSSIQPNSLSRTSSRSFVADAKVPSSVLNRSTYSAALPSNVQRSQPASQASGARAGSGSSNVAAARAQVGTLSGSAGHSTVTTGASGYGGNQSAAEAANAARASLGMSGGRSSADSYRGGSQSSGSGGSSGYSRSGAEGSSGSGRSSYSGSSSGSSPYSSARSYGGSTRESSGSSSSGYRVGPSYGGSGRSSSGSGSSSGGSRGSGGGGGGVGGSSGGHGGR